jgi:DNA-binding GntR family transcriptional regulator
MVADRSRTLVETVYRRIRADIVQGTLPAGGALRIEHIKDNYGASGATLREALSLLVADALVTAEGRRGFRVTPISIQDLDDVTENRVRLETEALRQAIDHGDEVWESDVVAAYHLLSRIDSRIQSVRSLEAAQEYEVRNAVFHQTLIRACPSKWLLRFVHVLYQQSERYRYLVIAKKPVPRDVHAEHSALMKAALDRDVKKASAVLTDHIRTTADAIKASSARSKILADEHKTPDKREERRGSPDAS